MGWKCVKGHVNISNGWSCAVCTEAMVQTTLLLTAENSNLRTTLLELTETVDDALLLDDELAHAWEDLWKGVVKARKALDTPYGSKLGN